MSAISPANGGWCSNGNDSTASPIVSNRRLRPSVLNDLLGDVPGIAIPRIPPDRTHVYLQHCAYVPDTDTIVKRCIRRGVDLAPMHVDVCTGMDLFGWKGPLARGAEIAARAVQVPVYESLSDQEIERVGRLLREQVVKVSA